MSLKKYLYGAAAASIVLAPVAVYAQTTTGSLRAYISDETGAPLANAVVEIRHVPTGTVYESETTGAGVVFESGLRVGGPYQITVMLAGFESQRVENLTVDLGQTLEVALRLEPGEASEEIIVTAQRAGVTAIGPSAVFNSDMLSTMPAINRDLRDIVRADPRIYLDEGFVDAVQCAGANPRFNSLTVDGVRLNDSFGLNSNGFPTERQPFPYDAVEQVAVELAPFDVEYGGFTACNINAVTKSGANNFFGSAFYDYTDDGLAGSSLEGNDINVAPFEEKRYGFTIGGPILRDRLFFFAAYESFEGVNNFDRGPEGSGAATEIGGFTQAEFDRITDIAQNIYGFDPGGLPVSAPNEDEKLLVRVDWNITNNHRAAVTYNYNDGFNITESDSGGGRFEYAGHLYERGAELNAYTASLFSDWSDRFSTEVRISHLDLDNRQIPQGGLDVGEVQIRDSGNTIFLGADDSRHANKLNYENLSLKFAGTYQLENGHIVTFGYERETLDVFNVFIQEAEGEYIFNSIDAFAAGTPNGGYRYENAPSHDPADAAAEFGYSLNTLYGQSEWSIGTDVQVTAGLRYDWYETEDAPVLNTAFETAFGFANNRTLNGLDLLQPRIGIQWDATDTLLIRGGLGLYTGGNPNVWLSNNYSNNGVTQIDVTNTRVGLAGTTSLFTLPHVAGEDGRNTPLIGIPQALYDAVTNRNGSVGEVNALDPDFETPVQWKAALGATWFADAPMLGGEYTINVDLLFNRAENAAEIDNIALTRTGTGPAGLPLYTSAGNAFLLTNSDDDADSLSFAASVAKDYEFGLSWTFGYAYNDAEDVSPMTSSVAFSNFNNAAYLDPNDRQAAATNYNIEHRFTASVIYEKAFFGEYLTKFALFGQANEGPPFSLTFDSGSVQPQGADSTLLYVPTGPTDPLVVYAAGFNTEAFFDYLEDIGAMDYAGGFAPRNAFSSDWYGKVDLRIEQELPGAMEGHRSSVFLVVENLTNLINDEWGIFREQSFPRLADVVDAELTADASQFRYLAFFDRQQGRVARPSLYEIRVGVRYEF